jgi:tetratricopeptide (TPR) repeat protein
MDSKSMGMIIATERNRKQLSQDELGKLIGISRSSIGRLELGQVSDQEVYFAAARQLGFDIKEKLLLSNDTDHAKMILLHKTDLAPATDALLAELEPQDMKSNLEHTGFLLVHKSKVLLFQKKMKKAVQVGEEAIQYLRKHIKKLKHTNLLSYVYNVIANAKYFLNDVDGALKAIDNSIAAFDESGENPKLFYQLRINRCVFLEKMGRFLYAHDDIEYLYLVLDEIDDPDVRLKVLGYKSLLEKIKSRNTTALMIAKEALEYARDNKKYDQHCWITSLVAILYSDLGEKKKAEDYFQLALSYQDRLSNPIIIVEAYTKKGSFHMAEGQINQAKACFDAAISICQQNSYNGHRFVNVLVALSDYYIGIDQLKEAEKHLLTALEIAENRQSDKLETIILLLTKVYKTQNTEKFFFYSEKHLMLHTQKLEVHKL